MFLKKGLTLIVSAALMLTLLASCSGGGTTETTKPGGSESASTTKDTQDTDDTDDTDDSEPGGEKVNDIMYKEGLPIVDPGTYSFSLFVDDSQDDDDYVMFDILEEQTGVKVELQKYPYAIATERLTLDLNTGDYADVIGGWTLSANSILTMGVEEGVYIPLEELFELYAPKMQELLALEGVRDTMTAPDGHIYSIPYVLEAPAVPFNPFINTKWLENVGMDVPTTTEEFRDVLRAFKEQDANGNGDPNDEIPFTTGPDNKHLGDLAGWFGLSVNDEGFTMEDGKLTFGADRDEYKEGIKFLASLYAEGLIDPEVFTQDSSQWKGKGAQDVYGVSIMYASSDIMPYEAGQEPDWVPVPVLSSSSDVKQVYLRDTYGNTVLKNQVVVTDNAEHPEVIVRWWDNFFQLENSLQSQRGPLGITLIKEDDGTYTAKDVSQMSQEDQDLYDWGNLFPQSLPKYIPAGFTYNVEVETFDEKAVVDELYEPYLTDAIPSYWVKAEDATKMSDISTAIKDFITQKQAQWISGQSDIDAEWETYKDQLQGLGVQDLIDMRLRALGD